MSQHTTPRLTSRSKRLKVGVVLAACASVGVVIVAPTAQSEAARPLTYRTGTPGAAPLPKGPVATWPNVVRIGTTVRGRPIEAVRQGNPRSGKVLLAVGVIHGNEQKGAYIVDLLRKVPVPVRSNYQIWTVRTMNPDGMAMNNRYNARGVDLNRNFPYGWSRWTYGAGRSAGSEAETQTMVNFMNRLRPDASIVYHQDWNQVLGCTSKVRKYALRYAALAHIPPEPCNRAYTGVLGGWFNNTYPGYTLTVELPPSSRIGPNWLMLWRNTLIAVANELPNLDKTSVVG